MKKPLSFLFILFTFIAVNAHDNSSKEEVFLKVDVMLKFPHGMEVLL